MIMDSIGNQSYISCQILFLLLENIASVTHFNQIVVGIDN